MSTPITVLRAQHTTHRPEREDAWLSVGQDSDAVTLHMQDGETVVLSRLELEAALEAGQP